MAKDGDLLKITRFNGVETFTLESASCRIWRDDDADLTRAVFELKGKAAVATLPDTCNRKAKPTWVLEWSGKKKLAQVLAAGAVLRVPKGYSDDDEYLTLFHYADDEPSDKNTVEIVSVTGKKVRAKLTGQTLDANFYDGSKPAMKLEVSATFAWNEDLSDGQVG